MKLIGTIYGMKGESDEVFRVGTQATIGNLIYNLAHYNQVSYDEMILILQRSNDNNPVRYFDEVYWIEN